MTSLRRMKNAKAAPFMLALLLLLASSSTTIPFSSFGINAIVAHAVDVEEETCSSIGSDGTCSEGGVTAANDGAADEEDDEEEDDSPQVECIDHDENCATWSSQGDCDTNPGYMTHHCSSSCNTCEVLEAAAKDAEFADEGVNTAPCRDDHYQCLDWAGSGECDANPGYMLKSCRRACLVCYEGT